MTVKQGTLQTVLHAHPLSKKFKKEEKRTKKCMPIHLLCFYYYFVLNSIAEASPGSAQNVPFAALDSRWWFGNDLRKFLSTNDVEH